MIRRYEVGDSVTLTEDAANNYSIDSNINFLVGSVHTFYCPAKTHYNHTNCNGHPGFDDGVGQALYELDGLIYAVYDWELK